MNKNGKDFFIKDLSVLPNYGFELAPSGDYWRICFRNATSLIVVCETYRIDFLSPCKSAIALLCEMYKNGDVIIVERNVISLKTSSCAK